ncbi:ABC transporter ATP-binding protein/permease [Roseomonas sp. OT10]|uniref:ABC transporter ATP-binding protein/permease n=1 Tax=Roseomonas cutis TaxID=2897332 RepID=UPI001E3BE534|nr:ABC transporter ATP-binding protein/permease [Roseomonas sp. OT10]UFN51055.1 ABC transporter ATP-binding protein/permease [Roseomonas sp. OT10]
MRGTIGVLRDAWSLTRPFWTGDERWRARGLLAVVVLLNLALVAMNVILTFWQRAFYNALQEKDWDAFLGLLFLGRPDAEDGFFGYLPGFCVVAALFILVAVYQLYLRQLLIIRWRRWMTADLVGRWLHDRAYYRIALADPGTDNPDQRIAEDVRGFVEQNLSLGLGLLSSIVTLLSFIVVLWSLSDAVNVLNLPIPGYLVWVALLYSVLGTWITHLIGRRLVGLNFERQRVEADFRFSLVRVRENTEGIALHRGEAMEERNLAGRFAAVIGNWRQLMTVTKQLTFFTAGFAQVAVVFPFVVAAPAFFAGRIPLGALIQTSTAFGQVQGSFSWFIDSYTLLTEWRATVARLAGFRDAVARAEAAKADGPRICPAEGPELTATGLDLDLPDGRRLMQDAALSVRPGEAVLVTGPSGSGKSTLFRALAGIWPFGRGAVDIPARGRVLFLPQRPYIPLGTLRTAVCYPDSPEAHSDAEVREALEAAGLGALVPRLDEADAWERRLSGGEQQRLALARALLFRPDWLFLDEATASLDPESEERLYRLLRERLPDTALVSIAHRPAVAQFHDRSLRLRDRHLVPG